MLASRSIDHFLLRNIISDIRGREVSDAFGNRYIILDSTVEDGIVVRDGTRIPSLYTSHTQFQLVHMDDE